MKDERSSVTVKIPRTVAEQLEEVRLSGETNMMDAPAVQAIANRMGHHALVVWMEESLVRRGYGVRVNPDSDYARGMTEGFEPYDEEEKHVKMTFAEALRNALDVITDEAEELWRDLSDSPPDDGESDERTERADLLMRVQASLSEGLDREERK